MSSDVIVIGCVGIDTNVHFPAPEIDLAVEGHFTENIDCLGQSGAFASRGYRNLGRRPAFIGYVGDDPFGHFIRQELQRDGTDTRALFTDPAGTARSVNFMLQDGQRRNFYDGKGHRLVQPDLALCRGVMEGARLAHFSIPHWARLLLPMARELGLVIACDVQDIAEPEDPYRRDFLEEADILFLSRVKLPDAAGFMEGRLTRKPSQLIIVGMGSEGCLLGSSRGVEHHPAIELEEPVIDTNGAGDSLAVGFLTSFVFGGHSLEHSLLRGQIAARYACAQKTGSAGLITLDRLEREFRARV